MNQTHLNWLRRSTTRLESTEPEGALSAEERTALERIVGSARVVGLGELTHGSRELARARDRLVRFLVREKGFTTVVLETCLASTRRLDSFVTSPSGPLALALAETGYWSSANSELLGLAEWLRAHNGAVQDLERRVRVFGCDVQSIDGAKRGLLQSLEHFVRARQLSPEVQRDAAALIGSLPNDAALQRHVLALVDELSAPSPSEAVIAELQARQARYLTGVRESARQVGLAAREIGRAVSTEHDAEERFFFSRCTRLLEQVIDLSAPDFRKRDGFMAENIRSLLEFFPERKFVLLFANVHVSRVPLFLEGVRFDPMGATLAAELNDSYRAIGSAFHHGEYLGATGTKPSDEDVVRAHHPRASAFEAVLGDFGASHGTPDFLVQLNSAEGPPFPWPDSLEMNLGEAGGLRSYEATFVPQRPQLQYDGLVFVTRSSPITVLREYYEQAQRQPS